MTIRILITKLKIRIKKKYQFWYLSRILNQKEEQYKSIISTLIFENDITNRLIKKILKIIIYPRAQKEQTQIIENQKKVMFEYLLMTSNTKLGKKYNFEDLLIKYDKKTEIYKKFSKKVPISEYDKFKKRIDLSKEKKDIIRPGQINKFSASAGTTAVSQEDGNKKTIPVTYESMKSTQKAGQEMLSEYVTAFSDTKIFKGYTLPLVGNIQNISKNNIITGDVSALILLERNSITKAKYAFNVKSLIEPNRDKKRKLFGEQLDPNHKLLMIGVTSWADELLNYREENYSQKYTTLIKKNNLEVVFGGGVDVAPYIDKFNKLQIRYLGNYNASEGVFGYQNITKYDNSKGKAAYKLLGNHGIFYEFIPFNSDNFDENGELKSKAVARPLREIEYNKYKHKKLALIITTNSGLCRYLIGDVIEFIDDEYNFKIIGRTRQCLNLKGEELMETHINHVINELSKKNNINIKNYTIGPDKESEPTKHQRIVEIEEPQDNKTIESSNPYSNLHKKELTKTIDTLLQKINPDYQAKRKNDMLLKMPEIIFTNTSENIFYNRLKSKSKLGGQSKIPKLSHNRKILEEILKINKKIKL